MKMPNPPDIWRINVYKMSKLTKIKELDPG